MTPEQRAIKNVGKQVCKKYKKQQKVLPTENPTEGQQEMGCSYTNYPSL